MYVAAFLRLWEKPPLYRVSRTKTTPAESAMHNWWIYSLKIFCELPVKLSPMLCIASTQFTIYWKLLPGCHQATGTLLTSLASSRKVAGALNTLITSADREAVSGLQGKSLHSKLELADPGLAQRTQSRLVPTGTSQMISPLGFLRTPRMCMNCILIIKHKIILTAHFFVQVDTSAFIVSNHYRFGACLQPQPHYSYTDTTTFRLPTHSFSVPSKWKSNSEESQNYWAAFFLWVFKCSNTPASESTVFGGLIVLYHTAKRQQLGERTSMWERKKETEFACVEVQRLGREGKTSTEIARLERRDRTSHIRDDQYNS